MNNPFFYAQTTPNGLVKTLRAVTPNDSTDNVGGDIAIGLLVTQGGQVSFLDVDDNTITITLPDFGAVVCSVKRVRSTDTSASGIFAVIGA